MAAVNWDQPSQGDVIDPSPSLELGNKKGGALLARSRGVALDASSDKAEALIARTQATVAATIRSESFIGMTCFGPKATASIGANQSELVAVAGVNLVDPAKPNDSLHGIGVAGISNRLAGQGVVGATLGFRSIGVLGEALGGGVGVRGTGSQGGVQGSSTASPGVAGTSGTAAGVAGQSQGAAGVEGASIAGPGVHGTSAQAQGVVGEASGNNAAGVFGRNDAASGVGVDGYSKAGIGVRAIASSGTALHAEAVSGVGIDASNFSTSQPAVKAYSPGAPGVDAMSLTNSAVKGASAYAGVSGTAIGAPSASDPQAGCGVYGVSLGGAGVCGITAVGTGVMGIGQPVLGAWAGRFVGNVRVDGILFKSASLFSIDHPLDPKRKVLNHACVESPEYKTFYDGIVTLGRGGRATVRLPRWFAALNDELRYQLTPLGAAASELHIEQEAADGTFRIAGGHPGLRVCWQVTGVRRDAWARANPLVVEQARGTMHDAPPAPSAAALRRHEAVLRKVGASLEQQRSRRVKAPHPATQPTRAASSADERDAELDRVRERLRQLAKTVQRLSEHGEPRDD